MVHITFVYVARPRIWLRIALSLLRRPLISNGLLGYLGELVFRYRGSGESMIPGPSVFWKVRSRYSIQLISRYLKS